MPIRSLTVNSSRFVSGRLPNKKWFLYQISMFWCHSSGRMVFSICINHEQIPVLVTHMAQSKIVCRQQWTSNSIWRMVIKRPERNKSALRNNKNTTKRLSLSLCLCIQKFHRKHLLATAAEYRPLMRIGLLVMNTLNNGIPLLRSAVKVCCVHLAHICHAHIEHCWLMRLAWVHQKPAKLKKWRSGKWKWNKNKMRKLGPSLWMSTKCIFICHIQMQMHI